MSNRTVLISGASIAGPALAFWLGRCGYAVTVVERAPDLRLGGQAVDFKGEVHRKVLERMGILDDVLRRQTGKTDLLIVDERDRHLATIPGEFVGGDIEIARGDLTEILYRRTAESCEYLFGDSVTALVDTDSGVEVTFEKSDARRFDLVFGADGIHSAVRRHRFGPEDEFVRFLGYYYAVVGTTGSASDASPDRERGTGLMYNEPGRMAVVGGPKAPELFVFASDRIEYDRADITQQKRMLTAAYAGAGWRVPGYSRTWTTRPTSTSTRSRGSRPIPTPPAVWPWSVMPRTEIRWAASGPASPSWVRTSWRVSSPLQTATTAWRSDATTKRCSGTRRSPARAVPDRFSRRSRLLESGCATGRSSPLSCSA